MTDEINSTERWYDAEDFAQLAGERYSPADLHRIYHVWARRVRAPVMSLPHWGRTLREILARSPHPILRPHRSHGARYYVVDPEAVAASHRALVEELVASL